MTARVPLAVHAQIVVGLELRATVQLASERPANAASYAQLAMDVAARQHPGWFVSPALEELILQLGANLDPDAPGVDPAGPIVHVLAGDTGKLVERARCWWRADPSARLIALPDAATDPLTAAAAIREQTAGASLMVLHGPGDALSPLVALAGWARRPPVVLVERDELAWWAGTSIADAVIHSSTAAVALAAERRCLPPSRSVLVERYERDDAHGLSEVLAEIRQRVVGWPGPRVPTALLPAPATLIDQRVVARQIESGDADGIAGALRRWPPTSELLQRGGWVILGRDPDRVLEMLRAALGEFEGLVPDVVLVDLDGTGAFRELAADLAGIVEVIEPAEPLSIDDATTIGMRSLVSDEIMVCTDGVATQLAELGRLQTLVRSGRPAVSVGAVGPGERLELRRHPRHVGFPPAVPFEHPAMRAEVASDGEGTDVRESSDITENREELFHTEAEVPVGPPEVE